jgi:6-phosphogluconate dehydrogenase
MQIGMIGLGKMGANMTIRLMRGGHRCVVFDLNADNVRKLSQHGASPATALKDFVQQLEKPRVAWIMVSAGAATDKTVTELAGLMEAGDIIIDGGNSFYQDDLRHAQELKERGIYFIDAGTSGGVWGIDRGYCLMIGGEEKAVQHCDAIFKTLAPGIGNIERTPGREKMAGNNTAEEGYLHCGPVGAGHFVKMVHNGLEYGMMQAYAEGFDVLKGATAKEIPEIRRYQFNLADIAEVWRRGSVIGSWLLDLSAISLLQDPELKQFSGYVQDSGEGRWTINAAIEEGVSAEVLASALFKRFRSRQEHSYADKLLSAMRFQFGGHVELKSGN